MADNRKTLESIPVPASGAAPDPLASGPSATGGADTGGISRTADSALGESIGLTGDVPAIGPNTSDAAGPAQESSAGAGNAARAAQPTAARPPGPSVTDKPHDDGPLDSLGKAIIAPVTGSEHEAPPRR